MITLSEIAALAAAVYGLDADAVLGSKRTKAVSEARQLAMWAAREMTASSSVDIGAVFGRSHSTVLFGIDAAEQRIRNDPVTQARSELLLTHIRRRPGMAELAAVARAQLAQRDEAAIAAGETRDEQLVAAAIAHGEA